MSVHKSRKIVFTPNLYNFRSKKRQTNDDDDQISKRASKNPRIEISNNDNDSAMIIDNEKSFTKPTSPSTTISPLTSSDNNNSHDDSNQTIKNCEDNEVSSELKKMSLDNNNNDDNNNNNETTTTMMMEDKSELKMDFISVAKGVCCIAQNFEEFNPLIKTFLSLGKEIISLYEKAEHHKELCSYLLQRCNCATAAVQDLHIRKTENERFFCKKGNFDLFKDFIKCIKKIKNFIEEISQLGKFRKLLYANNIEETFSKLITEFDGYMNSLNFSFAIQAIDEFKIIKNETREIKELLLNIYGVPDDKQSQQNFLKDMDSFAERNKEYQKQSKQNKALDSSEFKILEENEPLLEGSEYQKTKICPSKRIEKRTKNIEETNNEETNNEETNNEETNNKETNNEEEFCFKEFSNNSTTTPSDESQIEIRRQVNILKELKQSDHIIRFYGVAKENSKFYLVTEWMECGNLNEYYTNHVDNMDWKTKIKFALDICCGISYLNDCQILHHDIQSANILVDKNNKIKITNFGLSKKFYDLTRNISPNIENVRYMAPEKLLMEDDTKNEKAPYDSKCEIYSVGALLWEIAELKKPHSDLNKSEILVGIRKRVSERYCLPFSDGIPEEWKNLVKSAMLHEPACRPKISKICHKLHKLSTSNTLNTEFPTLDDCSEDYEENISSIDDNQNNQNTITSFITITILTVEDAVRAHRSKNGNKQLAWQSFKYHSVTDIYAKYMVGYYYYHDDEVPELQKISKDERLRIAVEIFKETADKGNPSAQLRYGICLWQGEGISANSFEALKYLKLAARQGNSAAMYVVGKAYLNGGNGIEQDRDKGAEYLKGAASKNHQKAREMCVKNNIIF